MSKKKPVKTALRRRSRAERSVPRDRYRNEILDALNSAGAPLTTPELAARLGIKAGERKALDAALAALERAGEVVQNRAGALLVAKRIALVAGRVEGHRDGHGFLEPDDGGPRVFLPPAEMREVIHGDHTAVPDGRRFDLVAAFEVLEHIRNDDELSGVPVVVFTAWMILLSVMVLRSIKDKEQRAQAEPD